MAPEAAPLAARPIQATNVQRPASREGTISVVNKGRQALGGWPDLRGLVQEGDDRPQLEVQFTEAALLDGGEVLLRVGQGLAGLDAVPARPDHSLESVRDLSDCDGAHRATFWGLMRLSIWS